jgi:hypothetical protein
MDIVRELKAAKGLYVDWGTIVSLTVLHRKELKLSFRWRRKIDS